MYTKILVPLDGSASAERVLPHLKWFLKVSHVNEVIFMQAVEPFKSRGMGAVLIPEERANIEKDAAKIAKKYLNKVARKFKSDKLKVRTEALVGKPSKIVQDYVSKADVDLIIMAVRKLTGLNRLVRGTVTDEILHASKVPVFLVKWQDRPPDTK
jgi:nucleotide-binding universal stress UspA family protein